VPGRAFPVIRRELARGEFSTPVRDASALTFVFGSCHRPTVDWTLERWQALARRTDYELALLIGDQIYEDELEHLGDTWFERYVNRYHQFWGYWPVREVLRRTPTYMIFDDHDVRDDWNTSAAWRAQMARQPWWRDRIRSALASYWVYQHIGNLSPDELAGDPVYQAVLGAEGDAWPVLVSMADRADAETDGAKGVRFSFRWDFGRTRLVMIDSRNGRILDRGEHLMLSESEFGWVEKQATDCLAELDHLLLGTSLPWLLPNAISDLESINEIATARPGWRGRLGERLRQGGDLEHWAAFRSSFDRLTKLIADVSSSPDGPATVSVLSGDVHHGYVARARLERDPRARVHQITCSPVHNYVPWMIKPGFRLGWSGFVALATGRWAARQGVSPLPVRWRELLGPLFGNLIATLDITGRHARVRFEQPISDGELVERAGLELGR
jgi:PhoD-like phosphatase